MIAAGVTPSNAANLELPSQICAACLINSCASIVAHTLSSVNIDVKLFFVTVDEVNKIDLRALRRLNLNNLITTKFGGHQSDFAAASKKNPTQVNHWISGHRNPNGDTCRNVERAIGYPPGWMDQDHSQESTTATTQTTITTSALAPVASSTHSADCDKLCRMFETLPEDDFVRAEAMARIGEVIKQVKGPPAPQEVPERTGKPKAA